MRLRAHRVDTTLPPAEDGKEQEQNEDSKTERDLETFRMHLVAIRADKREFRASTDR